MFKILKIALIISLIINNVDLIYTAWNFSEWTKLGFNAVEKELNPFSRAFMLNFGIEGWVTLKVLISIYLVLVTAMMLKVDSYCTQRGVKYAERKKKKNM